MPGFLSRTKVIGTVVQVGFGKKLSCNHHMFASQTKVLVARRVHIGYSVQVDCTVGSWGGQGGGGAEEVRPSGG